MHGSHEVRQVTLSPKQLLDRVFVVLESLSWKREIHSVATIKYVCRELLMLQRNNFSCTMRAI